MEMFEVGLIVLGTVALKGAGIVALVYVGARLAIRHERRALE
jgi:hypothetical protein